MSLDETVVNISPDGIVTFIYDDALRDLMEAGSAKICRASHVEPDDDGHWVADLGPVQGPKLGPFSMRRDALAAEKEWLEQNVL